MVKERGRLTQMVFFQRFRGASDDWEGEIATSLTAVKAFLEKSERAFAIEHPCSVVLVSSVNAHFISRQLPCSYHLAKAGMCQMVRYYAVALGDKGIRVNGVCPASFIKPENERYYQEHQELYRKMAECSPLKRMGSCTDVAEAVFFLISEKASFITGQSLVVDGGISLQWHESLAA
jgi:NAD(P)-dependent dehydrogenase (short-subunit alcohol dehydrogenase family)